MNRLKLSNIPLATFRRFLLSQGCILISTSGGHEKWHKDGCLRSIIIQTHQDPVPEIVVRSNLRTLSLSRHDFEQWLLLDN